MAKLFLFGAGASYGSGPCTPHNPPLGAKLFSALQKQGGAAECVSDELAALFEKDFEEGMVEFWKTHNTRSTELLRDMARYFAQFYLASGNFYTQLIKLVSQSPSKPIFSTTNYDLLLEYAISEAGYRMTYGEYPPLLGNFSLLKIHGSCNFLPDMDPRQIHGAAFNLINSKAGFALEAPVKAAQANEVIQFCDEADSIAPALAIYSPEKQVLFCEKFIKAQQECWKRVVAQSSHIYLIGIRVHPVDTHIWGELARCSAQLKYVGFEPGEFTAWSTQNGRYRDQILARSFEESLRHIELDFNESQ